MTKEYTPPPTLNPDPQKMMTMTLSELDWHIIAASLTTMAHAEVKFPDELAKEAMGFMPTDEYLGVSEKARILAQKTYLKIEKVLKDEN